MEHAFVRSRLDLPSEAEVWSAAAEVLLEVAYTPVVPYPYQVRSSVPVPVQARQLEGGDYLVIHDPIQPVASAERVNAAALAVMRARFLVYKGALHRLFPTLGYNEKSVAAGLYFDGVVPFAGGRLHDRMWRR